MLLHCRFLVQGCRGARSLGVSRISRGLAAGITTEADVKLELHDLPPYEFTEDELRTYNAAVEVINRIKSYGHPATYICGGWVRDKYLNRASLDIDITTSCDPNTVRRLFRRTQVLPRNTVRVIHDDGRSHFEVTTFRGYSRNSDLLSACLDAEMRDFTMNALFYDTDRLKVMDFVGGVPDLQRRVLRLCRNPRTRLQEDPLRVVRGLRFATGMRFKLSPDTAAALRDVGAACSPERGMPAGRIWKELQKMNKAEAQVPGSFMAALRLAFHLGFLPHLLPFLATEEALAKAVAAAEKLPVEMPLELRLAAMLHPSPNPDMYMQIARRFMLGNAEQENLEMLHQLVEMCMGGGGEALSGSVAPGDQRRWVAFYSHPSAELCLKVLEAWMPDVVLQQFRAFHEEKRAALEADIAAAWQQRQREEEAQRKAAQQRRLLSSRAFDPKFRSRTSPRVGDLLPPDYLQALVQKFNQEQGTAAAPLSIPPTPSSSTPTAGPAAASPSSSTRAVDPAATLPGTPGSPPIPSPSTTAVAAPSRAGASGDSTAGPAASTSTTAGASLQHRQRASGDPTAGPAASTSTAAASQEHGRHSEGGHAVGRSEGKRSSSGGGGGGSEGSSSASCSGRGGGGGEGSSSSWGEGSGSSSTSERSGTVHEARAAEGWTASGQRGAGAALQWRHLDAGGTSGSGVAAGDLCTQAPSSSAVCHS